MEAVHRESDRGLGLTECTFAVTSFLSLTVWHNAVLALSVPCQCSVSCLPYIQSQQIASPAYYSEYSDSRSRT
jgi:hypothetical protein